MPATVTAPDPRTVTAPDPRTVTAPDPRTVTAPDPRTVAAHVTMRRIAAQLDRRARAHGNGYRGPLTRNELAQLNARHPAEAH